MIEFFKYDDGICKINIAEYNYPKSIFNLKNEIELEDFIKTINKLYDLCDDDRLNYEDNANEEFYLRERIVNLIQEELNKQYRQLNLNETTVDDLDKIMAKIDVLEYLMEKIDEILN